MKNLFLLLVFMIIGGLSAYAQQVPQGMRYQAVARDMDGKLIENQPISLQISLKAGERGEVLYTEQHRVTTNALGLFSITVGSGKVMLGEFGSIPWSLADIWLDIDMDDQGGQRFVAINSSQLLAVPYAFHAGTAGSLTGEESDLGKNGLQFYWSINGNIGTFPSNHYIGTRDFKDLLFKTNSIQRMSITKEGLVDINGSLNVGDNLTVGNNALIGNDLRVDRDASIGRDLLVESNTELQGTLGVDGITTLRNPAESTMNNNGSLVVLGGAGIQKNVNIGGNTEIDGTLGVDGVTNLKNTTESTSKNNGALVVAGGVGIEKNVNIGGNTEIDGTLGVDGVTTLKNTTESTTKDNGSLVVEGGVGIEKNINVGGNSVVTGNSTVNGSTGLNGQVTINANVGGGDASYGAYPLRVQGSAQGLAIQLTAGVPNNSNNFITFFNSAGGAVGRIEGQTAGEVASSPQYIFDLSILVATEIAKGVNVGLAAIPIVVGGLGASTGPCGACLAMAAADLALATADLIAYNVFAFENLGVTYESGSADYAEWLERLNPEERLTPGDIVGVYAGKVTKNTTNAQQFLAISTKPAILGNLPADGQVEKFNKVAFMGQIPVKVRGVVMPGDYILPSDLNDGTGIGISPDEIAADQYRKIVGVSWSSSYLQDGVSMVNMAIGLNSNDVATLAAKQEKKIKALEEKFNSLEERLLALEKGEPMPPIREKSPSELAPKAKELVEVMSRNEIIASQMPAELSDELMAEAMQYIEGEYVRRGIDIAQHPGIYKLLRDESYQKEIIRKTQENYRATYQNIQHQVSE